MNRMQIRTLLAVAAVTTLTTAVLPGGAARAAVSAPPASLLGVTYTDGVMYQVSPTTAAGTTVGTTGLADVADLATAPDGTLYAFTVGSSQNLYRLDGTTYKPTLIGSLGTSFIFEGGLTVTPSGTAYLTNGGGNSAAQLLTVNLGTAATAEVGVLSGGNHDINGLAYRSDGKLIGLDDVTNSLLVIDPTTAATSVLATVPSTVGGVGGLTIAADGVGYFATAGAGLSDGPGADQLYSFDPYTGAETDIGSLAPAIAGGGLGGLTSVAAVPEPATASALAVAALTACGRRRRRR